MSKRSVDFVSTDDKLQRVISSDQQLAALKKMRNVETDKEWKQQIQNLIDKRIAELTCELQKS